MQVRGTALTSIRTRAEDKPTEQTDRNGDSLIAYLTLVLLYIAIVSVFVFAWWRIWEKAGYKGVWALLMLIPVVNIAAFLYLAFSDWPVHRFLDRLDDEF